MMLYPLLFIIWSHAYYSYREALPKTNIVFERIILALAILVSLAVPAALFFDLSPYVTFVELKVLLIFIMCCLFAWLIYQFKSHKLLAFVGLLLTLRLAFSLFVLPHRGHHKIENYYKQAAIEMGNISKGKSFFFYQYHPGELAIPFHDRLIFYIERTRMSKVKFTENTAKPGYYFTFDRELKYPNARLVRTYHDLKFYEVSKGISRISEYMILSMEYPNSTEEIKETIFPDVFMVDWVRVWKKGNE